MGNKKNGTVSVRISLNQMDIEALILHRDRIIAFQEADKDDYLKEIRRTHEQLNRSRQEIADQEETLGDLRKNTMVLKNTLAHYRAHNTVLEISLDRLHEQQRTLESIIDEALTPKNGRKNPLNQDLTDGLKRIRRLLMEDSGDTNNTTQT